MNAFAPNPARINTLSPEGELSTILNADGTLTTWLFTDSGVREVATPAIRIVDIAELIVSTTF